MTDEHQLIESTSPLVVLCYSKCVPFVSGAAMFRFHKKRAQFNLFLNDTTLIMFYLKWLTFFSLCMHIHLEQFVIQFLAQGHFDSG